MIDEVSCRKCGADCTEHHWMCDRTDGQWCHDCFTTTACGKGKHGEECPTQVFTGSALGESE